MNSSLIFSLRHAEASLVEEALTFICNSEFRYFEISGDVFESNFYNALKRNFFESSKIVSGVHQIMAPSLSRNWANSNSAISAELNTLLTRNLSKILIENISMAEIDLAVDEILTGSDVENRSRIVSQVLQNEDLSGSRLLFPIRFPKVIPKSMEWRYVTMLQNEIANEEVSTVVNLFPYESSVDAFVDFFKKTFYTVSVIRLCFDPVTDGYLGRVSLKKWLQVFCDQGFEGRVILSPKIQNETILKECLEALSDLLKPYEFI